MTSMPEPQVGTYTGALVVLQYRGASDRTGKPVSWQHGWGWLDVLRTNQLEVTRRLRQYDNVVSTHFRTTDLRSFSFEAVEHPRSCSPREWWRTAASEHLTEQPNRMRMLPTANSPFMVSPVQDAGNLSVSTDAHVLICQTTQLERHLPAVLTHMGVDSQDIAPIGAHLQTMILGAEQARY